MKKGILLSLIAVLLMSTFVFAEVKPAPTNPGAKPPVKKMVKPTVKKMLKVKGKHLRGTKVGTMEPAGKKK